MRRNGLRLVGGILWFVAAVMVTGTSARAETADSAADSAADSLLDLLMQRDAQVYNLQRRVERLERSLATLEAATRTGTPAATSQPEPAITPAGPLAGTAAAAKTSKPQ